MGGMTPVWESELDDGLAIPFSLRKGVNEVTYRMLRPEDVDTEPKQEALMDRIQDIFDKHFGGSDEWVAKYNNYPWWQIKEFAIGSEDIGKNPYFSRYVVLAESGDELVGVLAFERFNPKIIAKDVGMIRRQKVRFDPADDSTMLKTGTIAALLKGLSVMRGAGFEKPRNMVEMLLRLAKNDGIELMSTDSKDPWRPRLVEPFWIISAPNKTELMRRFVRMAAQNDMGIFVIPANDALADTYEKKFAANLRFKSRDKETWMFALPGDVKKVAEARKRSYGRSVSARRSSTPMRRDSVVQEPPLEDAAPLRPLSRSRAGDTGRNPEPSPRRRSLPTPRVVSKSPVRDASRSRSRTDSGDAKAEMVQTSYPSRLKRGFGDGESKGGSSFDTSPVSPKSSAPPTPLDTIKSWLDANPETKYFFERMTALDLCSPIIHRLLKEREHESARNLIDGVHADHRFIEDDSLSPEVVDSILAAVDAAQSSFQVLHPRSGDFDPEQAASEALERECVAVGTVVRSLDSSKWVALITENTGYTIVDPPRRPRDRSALLGRGSPFVETAIRWAPRLLHFDDVDANDTILAVDVLSTFVIRALSYDAKDSENVYDADSSECRDRLYCLLIWHAAKSA